jgi:hypothetical protein
MLLLNVQSFAMAFSSSSVGTSKSLSQIQSNSQLLTRQSIVSDARHLLQMSSKVNEDDTSSPCRGNPPGRKRALVRKYGKAIALSTTLLYGPMLSVPFARRTLGSTAHAAASTATAPSKTDAYNFQDFKDVKKKLSLAPGANVQEYEEILERVAVEGDEALEELKYGQKEAALTIGGDDDGAGGEGGRGTLTRAEKRAQKKRQKQQSKNQQVSEWESDEFGFGEDDDDDLDSGVLTMGSSSTSSPGSKLSPSKSGGGKGDVVVTDKMAYSNYKAPDTKEDHMKKIKKGAFYSIFPVFVITMVRGQIRAYREKKWVKKGLAIVEEERKAYLEEKKKKKNGQKVSVLICVVSAYLLNCCIYESISRNNVSGR